MRLTFAAIALISVALRCGSLLSELERIRQKAGVAAAQSTSEPTVLYTVPADGSVSVAKQGYIDIVFDQPIDAATATGSNGNGSCLGTAVASYDGFQTCGGSASVTGNTVRLSAAPNMPLGVTIKIKVTAGLKGMNGVAAKAYQSATGISFATPCGQSCFHSDSAPMSAATQGGSHSFEIPAGPYAGSIITVAGNNTSNTTFWNAQTNQTAIGPPACGGMVNGANSFYVATQGGPRSGKIITWVGGAGTTACTYDPVTNQYAGTAQPSLGGANPNSGSLAIPISTGINAGNYMILNGTGTTVYVYNVAFDSFGTAGIATSSVGDGSSWFRLDTGGNAGKIFVVSGANTTNTQLIDETIPAYASPYIAAANHSIGSLLFRVNSGLWENQLMLANGWGTTNTYTYDQGGGTAPGPTLPCPIDAGSQAITLGSGPRSGQTLILCGGNPTPTADFTFYNHNIDSFVNLSGTIAATSTSMTGVVGQNSSITKITQGPLKGSYFLVNGNGTVNTSLFDPTLPGFVGTRLFKTTGTGISGFGIGTGVKAGRVMIMSGGFAATSSLATTIYDPKTGLTEIGPNLPGGNGIDAGATNFPVSTGVNAGKQYILKGNSTTVVLKYDPDNNMFAVAVGSGIDYSGTPQNKGAGSRALLMPNGPQASNYLILNGGGDNNADFFNTNTNSFSLAGTVTGCVSVNPGSWIFKVQSGIHAGKFMIICGTVLATSIFDPSGPSFTGGPSLISSPPNAGAHGFYIATGPDAGKFLFFPGVGTNTRMYDPTLNSWGAGPTLAACTGATQGVGGFAIPILAGVNAGKLLVVMGGGTTTNCYFNPVNSTFSNGPDTGPHAGYAIGANSLAFAISNGLYPNSYFIAHGNSTTVFSHWFAY